MLESIWNTTQPVDSFVEIAIRGVEYVLNMVRVLGTGLALIMITYIAFKYITASGPDAKGKIKESMSGFLIGAVVFIAASNIIYYIIVLVESIMTTMGVE